MSASGAVRAESRPSVSRRWRRRRRAWTSVAPLAALLIGAPIFVTVSQVSAAPIGLGTAKGFAVLGGSGITNTGATTVTGDVGSFPTPSETGFGSLTLSGVDHAGDAVTQGAKDSLVTAYTAAAGRKPVTSHAVELGGTTLFAGVYGSGTFGVTGTLTLDAQNDPNAQFIFQTDSTLIAEVGSRVSLINGADPCRVTWKVGSSATFKTDTVFVGDVLALTSITAQTRATFRGRLLASNGAVTLDTNTITNATCAGALGGATPTTPGTTGTATTPTTATPGGTATGGTATSTTVTSTTVTSSSNPAPSGQPVVLTATVTSAGATPTGSVTFYDSSTKIGTVTVTGGRASITTSTLTAGGHIITARFVGTGVNTDSSVVFRQSVTSFRVTPPGLPVTGGALPWFGIALGLLLLVGGAALVTHAVSNGRGRRPQPPPWAPG